jgi:prevent-host-death family protein
MSNTYPTWEAKAKFTELLRRVRGGHVVRISWRGKEVAELRPLAAARESFPERLARFEGCGIVTRPRNQFLPRVVARRPGALRRFLAERD